MRNIIALGALAALTVPAMALNALNFDVTSGGTAGNNDQTVGWEFDVLSTITVTHLAFYDEGQNGLTQSREVGLWDPTGTLISTGTVLGGTAATLDGVWRLVDVPDVTLALGNGYIIGALNNANNQDPIRSNVTHTFIAPEIRYIDAKFSGLNTLLTRPTQNSVAISGFYGPSFNYIQGVPEPATMSLLGLGALALLRKRRK